MAKPATRPACLVLFARARPVALVQAQPSLTGPTELMFSFRPGRETDPVARALGEHFTAACGQPSIVDFKPGAGAIIGTDFVAKAPADGYTLLMATAGETAINPHVYKAKMQYAPDKDLAPITLVVKVPNAVVVSPRLPARSMPELLGYAQATPG